MRSTSCWIFQSLGLSSFLLLPVQKSEAFLPSRQQQHFPKPECSHLWDAVNLKAPQKPDGVPLSPEDLNGYGNCTSFSQATRLLRERISIDQCDRLFDSVSIPPEASSRLISDGDLAIQTRLVNRKYKITELIELSGDRDADRASLAVISVMVGSVLSAVLANQNLPGPEIFRFVVVWVFSFAPLAFVGYGITNIENLQGVLVMIQRNVFPAYRSRMIQHEAGHFLLGHLLGWPVKTYSANAVKNAVEFFPFADLEKGAERARQLGFDTRRTSTSSTFDDGTQVFADVPYFSRDGRGASLLDQLSVFKDDDEEGYTVEGKKPPDDPSSVWPFRGFSDFELDKIAVISVAGVCAEILAFGDAEGGIADLNQLRVIFKNCVPNPGLTERDCDNRIRFALSFALTQLRCHLDVLDALAAVMERGGTVDECVVAIECCRFGRERDSIPSDYEARRRQLFQNHGTSFVEKLFLRRARNADAVEDRLVEGKGGGYRGSTFRLSGDDPLYAALALSTLFLIWASNGGLSLH